MMMMICESSGEGEASPYMQEMEISCRRWEELDTDLLVEIFSRLDVSDLLLSIPFVCKPWKEASQLPQSWRILNFHKSYDAVERSYALDGFTFSALLKLVLSRSRGCATHLSLPPNNFWLGITTLTEENLELLVNACPKLKYLAINSMEWKCEPKFYKLIGMWKDLECCLVRGHLHRFDKLFEQMGNSCRNLRCLQLMNICVGSKMTFAIVKHIPWIKRLYLWNLWMEKEDLLHILRGCKNLVQLSIKNCVGFEADEEIVRYGDSIGCFTCEGCKLHWEELFDRMWDSEDGCEL